MTPDPAAEYKALLDLAHRAATAHTAHERKRAQELTTEIHHATRAITEATEAERKATAEITDWWRGVVLALSNVGWLNAGPRPAPDSAADPTRFDEYMAEILPATTDLKQAIRRAVWPRRFNDRGRLGEPDKLW